MVNSMEKFVISKILEEGTLQPLEKVGVDESWFRDDKAKDAYKMILKFYKDRDKVPSVEAFKAERPNYVYEKSPEDWPYLLDKLASSYRTYLLGHSVADFVEAIDQKQYEEAKILNTEIDSILSIGPSSLGSRVNEEGMSKAIFQEMYTERNTLDSRIASGIDVLDEELGGFRKSDTVVIAALPGDGKTALLMHLADAAHIDGKRVLFFTFEMSVDEVRLRWVARNSEIPTKMLSPTWEGDPRDELSPRQEREWENSVETLFGNDSGLGIVELDIHSVTYSGMKKHIDRFDPDIVFIDGAYMIRDESGKDTQTLQIADLLANLRRYTLSARVPVVLTTQALRSKVGTGGIQPGSVGYSSSWEQFATIYIGIHRDAEETPEMQELRFFKLRNGLIKQADWPKIQWDFRKFTSETIDEFSNKPQLGGI
jgi:replicative DNA helicase